jgi:hypothetical protein
MGMEITSMPGIILIIGLSACAREKKQIVSVHFVDSLISHYQEPDFARSNDTNITFWKNRIIPGLPGIVSETKYAGALVTRFHVFGDLQDMKSADSTIRKIDSDFNHKESHAGLILVSYSILQHRFDEAGRWLERARQAGLKRYDFLTASFDVDFELGRYFNASNELKELKSTADYGYFFRRSKMDHLNGLLDSSILAMQKAADLEKDNPYLEQVALANTADLYIHAGDLQKAADLYMQCISMNGADFHSITGLGWIALVHDKNDVLAERIFDFVRKKNKLPDALYKLTQTAQSRMDSAMELKYAKDFEKQATEPEYGNMYNKYMIEFYTGILHDPARAEAISEKELKNRATPQTWAWYAWSLYSNHKKEEAYKTYAENVSGRPLEGLELYWMGKMMQGLHKGYNAQEFFKAARNNKYDLSPAVEQDLEKQLD